MLFVALIFALNNNAGFYTSELSPYPLPRMYSDCFVEALVNEAEKDKDIVVVHAGMGMEPPLQLFQEKFPYKFFDVGMAEQHAVTFSAGLACGGLKPFCIIPSTFLQRAYDQVLSLSHTHTHTRVRAHTFQSFSTLFNHC